MMKNNINFSWTNFQNPHQNFNAIQIRITHTQIKLYQPKSNRPNLQIKTTTTESKPSTPLNSPDRPNRIRPRSELVPTREEQSRTKETETGLILKNKSKPIPETERKKRVEGHQNRIRGGIKVVLFLSCV